MSTTETLLPCPFCGGGASGDATIKYSEKYAKKQGWDQTTFYYCNCIHCGANNQGIVGHLTRDAAIAAWNRRATPPAPAPDPWGYLCNGKGDGWAEKDKVVRDPDLIAQYREQPDKWRIEPLYLATMGAC